MIACGGDGTVRAVLEAIAGSNATLGVVPLGTGNLLASNLGIPTGLEAVPTAVAGQTRRLDVGTVNGERFAVMAGVGFDAAMIRDAAPGHQASIRQRRLRDLGRSQRAGQADSGDGRSRRAPGVGGANGDGAGRELQHRHRRPRRVPRRPSDDGVLDVAVLSAKKFGDWVSVFWRLVRSKPQRHELVARFTGTRVAVTMVNAMPYELDGEDRPPAEQLEFTIEPASLTVRVGDHAERGSHARPRASGPGARPTRPIAGPGRRAAGRRRRTVRVGCLPCRRHTRCEGSAPRRAHARAVGSARR